MYNSNSTLLTQEETFEKSLQRSQELEESALPRAPLPLQRETAEAKPFPFEALGPTLGDAAKKIHEIVRAPDAICANSMLAAASLAVQAYADVEIDGRRIPLSLFFISVAESGDRKSGADNIALQPIQSYQKMLLSMYEEDKRKYKNQKDAWDKKRQNILNSDESNIEESLNSLEEEPVPPLKPIVLMEEPTYEGLVKLLDIGQPSAGLFSDEGGRMIGGYGMDRNNLLKTASGLSSLWDGKPISRVRSGDESMVLYGKRLTMHLMIQEIILEGLLTNSTLIGQGLLARCLIAFPSSMSGKRPYQEKNPFEEQEIMNYCSRMNQILDHPFPMDDSKLKNTLTPQILSIADEAKSQWIAFHNSIDKELTPTGKYYAARRSANKAAEQVLRIAGVLTLFEDIETTSITHENIERGIALVTYYLDEALRFSDVVVSDPKLTLAQQVLEWMHRENKTKDIKVFPLSLIYQRGPKKIRDATKAREIMKILMEHEAILFHQNQEIEGKVAKEAWSLNPRFEEKVAS